MKTRSWWLVGLAVALIVPSLPAQGWIITQTDPNNSYAGYVAVPYYTLPTADVIEIHKYFVRDPDPGKVLIALQLQFVREAGDQDIIEIIDEFILNLQVVDNRTWDDFHVALIDGPELLARGDAVTFINPDGATAWQQTGGAPRLGGVPVNATPGRIDWETTDSSQSVPPGPFASAPLNQLVLRGIVIDASDVQVGEGFILKEWPTIPEPGTMALLAVGGAAVWFGRRGRRRSA